LKFKIDENLPAECAELLRIAGFGAETVADEHLTGAVDIVIASRSQEENRVLVTLDLEFGNIRTYPPSKYAGNIVLRPKRQDKRTFLNLMERIVLTLSSRTPTGELWTVEPDRIRFRTG
jgi:predicted nuclease of predicted toxin-antitoxin system